jgi:uncharacterized protein YndB with AHSA1/START domain
MKQILPVWFFVAAAVIGCAAEGTTATNTVQSTMYDDTAAGMVMHHRFRTAASPERIWAAIATADGLARWAAKEAKVELRPGGAYELYFRPENAPGKRGMEGNKVLSFAPHRVLSYSGGLPDTWVLYSIEPEPAGGAIVNFIAMGTHPDWKAKCAAQAPAVTAFVQKLADHLRP